MAPPSLKARKLLVASLGVATMSYLGTSCSSATSPDAGTDTGAEQAMGNLAVPPSDARPDTVDDFPVANLVAPPVDGGH